MVAGEAFAQTVSCSDPDVVFDCSDGGLWTTDTCWDSGAVPGSDDDVGHGLLDAVAELNASGSSRDLIVNSGADVAVVEGGDLNIFGNCVALDQGRILVETVVPEIDDDARLDLRASNTVIGGFFDDAPGTIRLEAESEDDLNSAVVNAGFDDIELRSEIALAGSGVVDAGTLVNNTGATTDPPEPPFTPGIYADLPGRTLFIGGGTHTNNSVIEARNGGILQLFSNWNQAPDAVILARDGSTVVLDDHEVNGGTLQSMGSGEIRITDAGGGAVISLVDVTVAADTLIRQISTDGNADTPVWIGGDLVNDGQWIMSNQAGQTSSFSDTRLEFVDADPVLSGNGEIFMTDDPDTRIRLRDDARGTVLTHGVGHTIRGSGELMAGLAALVNNGAILVDGSSPLIIEPDFSATGFENNGIVGGAGTIEFFNGTFDNGGMVAPGLSVGALMIDANDVTNSASARLDIEIGGDQTGEFDTLEVTGTYDAGGEIEVAVTGPFFPDGSESLTIVTASSVTGFFSNADPMGGNVATDIETGTVKFDVVYGPDSIRLENISREVLFADGFESI